MALVKYGGGVASMSGKLGGTVAARNRAGAYFRNWAFPTNAPTTIQTARRVAFAAISGTWSALGTSLRADWEAYAAATTEINRQGDTYVPTGRQVFMSCNSNLALISAAAITAPPTGAVPPTINSSASLAVGIDIGTIPPSIGSYIITNANVGTNDKLVVYGAPEQLGGKKNLTLLFRFVQSGTESSSVDATNKYVNHFGPDGTVGSVQQCKLRMISPTTGLSSPFLLLQTLSEGI